MADFDVIVIGSGMSGGWVAKEMCERGFKVCVIERGREIVPEKDFTDFQEPWEHEHLNWKRADEVRISHPERSLRVSQLYQTILGKG